MTRRDFIVSSGRGVMVLAAGAVGLRGGSPGADDGGKIRIFSVRNGGYVMVEKVVKEKAEWRKILTEEQFHITREKGTERAFTGKYWDHHAEGTYGCVCCGIDLFSSGTKFDSGTGWPSFTAPVAPENVRTETDTNFFVKRTEVLCARCAAHLGHVFDDGPPPTGLRYCINSASLVFTGKE